MMKRSVAVALAALSMASLAVAQTAPPTPGEAPAQAAETTGPAPEKTAPPAEASGDNMCIRRTFFSVVFTPFRAVTNTIVRVVNRNAPPPRHLCTSKLQAPMP